MESVWSVMPDIDLRIRPTVVQAGENVTLEDCEDTLHHVVGKAQQLFTCPVSKNAGNRIQDSDPHSDTDINLLSAMKQCWTRRRFVISVTKWMRTRLSSLVIPSTSFENILVQLVHASGARPLVGNALHWARSKVRSVSQW